MAGRDYWSDATTWACHSGMFIFGVVITILGAILPSLFETINLDPAQAGSLFLFLNFGSLLITLAAGPAFDIFGFRGILSACSFLAGTSLLAMSSAGSYPLLALSSFLLGIGGGGLNLGTNALVSDLYPQRQAAALNRLGIFFGLGTFAIPFAIGILLEAAGLRGVLILAGVGAMIPGVLFLTVHYPPSKHAAGFPVKEAAALLKHPFVLLLGFLLLFQSGNEMTTSGWLTTFVVRETEASPAGASFYLSGFWGAVILGRLAAGWLLSRIRPATLVQLNGLLSALFVLLFILFPGREISFLLACTIGLSMSTIFPTVMGEASARYPAFSGTVIGTLLAIALVGGMLAPYLAGLLVSNHGISAAFTLPIIGFQAIALIQTVVKRRF